jgi:hypothetical protein
MVKLTGPISEVEEKLRDELKPLTFLENPILKKLGIGTISEYERNNDSAEIYMCCGFAAKPVLVYGVANTRTDRAELYVEYEINPRQIMLNFTASLKNLFGSSGNKHYHRREILLTFGRKYADQLLEFDNRNKEENDVHEHNGAKIQVTVIEVPYEFMKSYELAEELLNEWNMDFIYFLNTEHESNYYSLQDKFHQCKEPNPDRGYRAALYIVALPVIYNALGGVPGNYPFQWVHEREIELTTAYKQLVSLGMHLYNDSNPLNLMEGLNIWNQDLFQVALQAIEIRKNGSSKPPQPYPGA